MNKFLISSLSILIILSGCTTLNSIFEEPISSPTLPIKSKKTTQSKKFIDQNTTDDIETLVINIQDYAQNNISHERIDTTLPYASSIVISVPVVDKSHTKDTYEKIASFKTIGHYSHAEQFIEKALIHKGFNLIDRSKLEAKIRDINKQKLGITETFSKDLNGSSIPTEYPRIFDEPEIIRAAITDEISALYLFHVNDMQVTYNKESHINLKRIKYISQYMSDRNISFGSAGVDMEFPSVIDIPMYKASFNAKLIDVKSGSIIWIGENLIDSRFSKDLKVEFVVKKTPKNIKDFDDYDTKVDKEYKKLEVYHSVVDQLTKEIKDNSDLEPTEQIEKNIKELKTRFNVAKESYDKQLVNYENLLLAEPRTKYTYKVVNSTVFPNLKNANTSDKELYQYERDLIRKHVSALINKLIKDSIDSIKMQELEQEQE